jgi:hypothetical protein
MRHRADQKPNFSFSGLTSSVPQLGASNLQSRVTPVVSSF